jgi:hypothetical protein
MPRDPKLEGASVSDAHGVIVVGYLKLEPERWYGTAEGFEALARLDYLDQLEVTFAEISARQHAAP